MTEAKSKSKVFEVVTDEFTRSVKWASKLTQGKDNPMISIKIDNNNLIMSAYNGVNSSKSKSAVTQQFEGELEFSILGSVLSNAIKSIKDSSIKCTVDGRTLVIKSAKAKFSLPITMPRNKLVLPPLPPAIGTVDAVEFKTLLGHAIAMTSDDASTPVLMTVRVEINPIDEEIRFMATDRYKLVVRKMAYTPAKESTETEIFGLDVEARSFKTLFADLDDSDTMTIYGSSSNDNRQFGISTSTQIGMVALKDVKPINFSQFLNMKHSKQIVFKRSDLTQAIAVTKPLIESSVKAADLVVEGDSMTVVSPLTDIDVDLFSTSGLDEDGKLEVHMNLDYLTPVLSAGKSTYVGLNIENPNKAIVIQEMLDEKTVNENYFSLVMPVLKQTGV